MEWWQIVENEEIYKRCQAMGTNIIDPLKVGHDLFAIIHRLHAFITPDDLPTQLKTSRITSQLEILAKEFKWDMVPRSRETDEARKHRMFMIFYMSVLIYFIGLERNVPLLPDPHEGLF